MFAYTFPLIVTVSASVRVLTNLEQKAICRVTKQWNDFFSVPSLGPHVRLCSFVKGFKMHTENSQGLEAGSWLSYGCLCPPIYENALPARFFIFLALPMLNSESFHASSTNKAWLSSRKKGNLSLFPCLVNECPYISISLDIVPC